MRAIWVIVGSLFVIQNAFCDSWIAPQEPLRLNIGFQKTSAAQLQGQSASGLVDLLPKIGGHDAAFSQKAMMVPSAEPQIIDWRALDAATTPMEFTSAVPFCAAPRDASLTTRAAAWEVAYRCLKGLATANTQAGTPFVNEFVGGISSGTKIYAIEPVLDLINEELTEKETSLLDNRQTSSDDTQTHFVPASPVWPTGSPGWHLDDDHSQLTSAYRSVFPNGVSTQGSVLIAHLDTGYFPGDTMRPKYVDKALSKTCGQATCYPGGEAHWDAKGPLVSPGHGTGTLSNLAGNAYTYKKDDQPLIMGGNPSAHVFSINIHDSVIHLDSRRMANGIENAVLDGADVITLSHGGLPSLRLASAVNYAYASGTPIFAATGDFFELPFFLGRTFQSVVYPARYSQVMGVAGVTMDGQSYGENPSVLWWFSFGPGYFSRIESWMLRGNFGPTSVMSDGKVISAYAPNITRSDAEPGNANVVGSNGAGTSHATPQVSAAASLWLEKNRPLFGDKWRSWEKSEAVYQALSESTSQCFADYNIEHYGRGILKARDALNWFYSPSYGDKTASVTGPNDKKVVLTPRTPADLDFSGFIQLFASARLPGQYEETVREAFVNALATELSQLVFTSEKLQKYLQQLHVCKPVDECEKCTRQDLTPHWSHIAQLVNDLPDASQTLKDTMLTITGAQTDL